MNCTLTHSGGKEWNEYISGSERRIYFDGAAITSPVHPNADHYGVYFNDLGSDQFEYDLIILSLEKADAGRYACKAIGMDTYFRYAQVVQVGKKMCTCFLRPYALNE